MMPAYWPEFLALLGLVVVAVAAALQAGDPRPWSWLRFGRAALLLSLALAGAIAAGQFAVTAYGGHVTSIAVGILAVAVALLLTALRTIHRRFTRSNPQEPAALDDGEAR
jgi:hypothetical protein